MSQSFQYGAQDMKKCNGPKAFEIDYDQGGADRLASFSARSG